MNLKEAITLFSEFKGKSLREKFRELEKVEANSSSHDFKKVFKAAQRIKVASAQINEVVHAAGIMLAESVWLKQNENVVYRSLGAGNHHGKFDLETNLRIAEFKFGKWNDSSANGQRRRSYFGNYVNLLLDESGRKKYFVVEDKIAFEKFLKENSGWRNVLSKNPTALKNLETFLKNNGLENLKTVGEIYRIKKPVVQIIDFSEIVK